MSKARKPEPAVSEPANDPMPVASAEGPRPAYLDRLGDARAATARNTRPAMAVAETVPTVQGTAVETAPPPPASIPAERIESARAAVQQHSRVSFPTDHIPASRRSELPPIDVAPPVPITLPLHIAPFVPGSPTLAEIERAIQAPDRPRSRGEVESHNQQIEDSLERALDDVKRNGRLSDSEREAKLRETRERFQEIPRLTYDAAALRDWRLAWTRHLERMEAEAKAAQPENEFLHELKMHHMLGTQEHLRLRYLSCMGDCQVIPRLRQMRDSLTDLVPERFRTRRDAICRAALLLENTLSGMIETHRIIRDCEPHDAPEGPEHRGSDRLQLAIVEVRKVLPAVTAKRDAFTAASLTKTWAELETFTG